MIFIIKSKTIILFYENYNIYNLLALLLPK